MNQELELERTFLAKRLPEELKGAPAIRIVDTYIPDTVEHAQLRLRQKGDKYEITKKVPVSETDFSAQIESTIILNQAEYEAIERSSRKRVCNDRSKVQIDAPWAEVDVFQEELAGLVLIDFEFGSQNERDEFKMPDVALADVTQEEFIAGGWLSGKSYDDIEVELAKYGYKRLS